MKMVMSADSSDCHPTSSSSVVVGAEAPSQSAKISVICHINQTNQNHNQNLQNHLENQQQQQQQLVEASAASSTTACAPYLINGGRSHLENALKLPPNTSVSAYYQNTKLLQQQQQQQLNSSSSPSVIMEERSYQNSQNPSMDYNSGNNSNRSSVSFIRNPSTTTTQSTSTAPVTDMDTVHTGAATAATSSNCNSSSSSSSVTCASSPSSVIYNSSQKSNSLILSQALQQPCSINAAHIYQNHQNNSNNGNNIVVSTSESLNLAYDNFYHHQQHQQQPNSPTAAMLYAPTHHNVAQAPPPPAPPLPPPPAQPLSLTANSGVVAVVAAADSRPQTPDYIKSYPVMDTTVASSVKGEPELNIEFDGTTVLCRVCGDKASGFHYGVHSCEGCKGFFRRSIQQKIQYRPCTKNQQCSILRINRNRCQYCRLKKCIAVGMSRDAVRFGRVPKREKARILAAMQQSTQNRGQQRALSGELDDQPRLLSAVLRAHLETCEFTKEKVAAMRQRARECPSYSMPTLLACPLNPAPELQSEQEFSQRFAHVIRGVIDFAGMIPGFQLLSQDDKFTLLKAGLFDALFVRLICMFDNSINSIICLNGQVMRRDAIQNGANARFLVDSTFNFAERMNSMNLTDAEIGLFCAIVLITPDRPGLRNIELIEKMYSRLKGCLQTIINQNRPDQPEFMSKLLETMPDLRTLSTLHTEKLVVFRTEHKELLRQQMWSMEDEQTALSKSPNNCWDDQRMDVEAKSPLGSVSSTESNDLEYQTASTTTTSNGGSTTSANHHVNHHLHHVQQNTSSLASSAPLLAATLSGTCPLRNRANSGSSGDSSVNELDLVVGSHAHLTQNGLTITPIVRAHSHQQLHHHLTAAAAAAVAGPHRYRKLDSPTDSGIESGNEKNECNKNVSSGGSSSCSSPRSSVDDALDCNDHHANNNPTTSQVTVSVSPVRSPQPLAQPASSTSSSINSSSCSNAVSTATLKRQIVDDMPVLKRVLQAPPLYDTNSLMDEAYKPHKKFRALRHREYECTEADASSSTNTPATSCVPQAASSPNTQQQQVAQQQPPNSHGQSSPTTVQNQQVLMVPQAMHSPPAAPLAASPPAIAQHQSQLHMHLTRPTPTNSNAGASSLSSTHSVLAKSLMAEPRMTPEQMKRSDIIQNYIMRDNQATNAASSSSSNGGLMVVGGSPHHNGSRSPSAHHLQLHNLYNNGSHSPNSTSNSPNSPSTTTSSSSNAAAVAAVATNNNRWPGHSVITTTTINQRQQSVSPSSNGSSASNSSNSSASSSSSSTGCQYFQSPHSTSASVSPPRPSPSQINTPPRLLELQVDIADSQQPLNLSKKSPTPPPTKLQALVAAANAAQRYPTALTADVTVTATTPSTTTQQQGSSNSNSNSSNNTSTPAAVVNTATAMQQQKVMLEA